MRLALYLPKSGQSDHEHNGRVLQSLYAELLGMPYENEVLQTLRDMGLLKIEGNGNISG